MKKFLFFLSTLGLLTAPTLALAGNYALGVSLSSNSLDTLGKEDVDSNGSIDAEKTVTDDFAVGSIFGEYTVMGDKLGLTVGINYIPFDADIDKRSITQSSDGGSDGTNSVEGTVEDHRTIYLQPGVALGSNSMFYLTYGFVSADFNGKSVSITHTDINETKSLDGTTVGLGLKRVSDNGLVFKIDYTSTDYDSVSFKTDNDTTATAELDNSAFAISVGKQF